MSDEAIYAGANTLPLLGWLLLAFAPLLRGRAVPAARAVAAAVAVLYVALAAASLGRAAGPLPDFTTLSGLAAALGDPRGALIGWCHFLALDLWTGTWAAEEAERRGVPHGALLPCLLLTFLAGPAGLLVFLAVRAVFGRRGRVRPA